MVLINDGLWNIYNQFYLGVCAEDMVNRYDISGAEQDEYAVMSFRRAQKVWKEDMFQVEIASVTIKSKKGEKVVFKDEGYQNSGEENVQSLKPVFVKDRGTATAASPSTFNNGASRLVLENREPASQHGNNSRVQARVVASADAAVDPVDFPVAPSKALPIAFERAGITKNQVSVRQVNEAFAAVALAKQKITSLDSADIDPLRGTIALCHALGSPGSRILTTLLHQLHPRQYGVATICNGGGAATATMVHYCIEKV